MGFFQDVVLVSNFKDLVGILCGKGLLARDWN